MTDLTEKQIKALRGELSAEQFEAEGMGLFQLGIVSIDPITPGAAGYVLTDKGRELAIRVRAENY